MSVTPAGIEHPSVSVLGQAVQLRDLPETPQTPQGDSLEKMSSVAWDLLRQTDVASIDSIECGHVHLDRDLDIDQRAGVAIGKTVLDGARKVMGRAPTLTPMLDDDHVLIKLHPKTYRDFLEEEFPGEPMHLLLESSPILRAIVCSMWSRLNELGLGNRLALRGGNLFMRLHDGNYCELFEDWDTDAVTGCVFFETALLVYRSDPAKFDTYFEERFNLSQPLHEHACSIWDGGEDHDTKLDRLTNYYDQFSSVMDPRSPDRDMEYLVNDILERTSGMTHLNVLEDYYESQQYKVRALLQLLRVPFRLVTIHFNAQTSRVVIDDSSNRYAG